MAESKSPSRRGTTELDPFIVRGSKTSLTYPKATFIGLRTLDPFLQYNLLTRPSLSPFLSTLNLPPHAYITPTLTIFSTPTSLTPHSLILLLMSTGSSIRQIHWISSTDEDINWKAAWLLPLWDTVHNSINSLLSTTEAVSLVHSYDPHLGWIAQVAQLLSVPRMTLGVVAFIVGMAVETVSEKQRTVFKRKAENKGKVFKGGLFKYARHINYTGYTLWRSGFALAGGGWFWAALSFGFFNYNFAASAIPVMDGNCEERYGVQWNGNKLDTPYNLWPGIY